jgi:O-succinylbenzoic acid--CoA ligase
MKWLKEQAEKSPNKLFLNQLTFKEVYDKTVQTAQHLNKEIARQNRLALLSENSPEMAIVLFALLALDKEVLLLNTHLTDIEIKEQLTELDVELLIASDQQNFPADLAFSDIVSLESSSAVLNWQSAPDKIAVIMNTSATTGKFKSVPITWKMIAAHVAASAATMGVLPEDNWLVMLPMFHVSGLSIIMRSLYNATQATIRASFDEEELLSLINDSSVNMVSMVPTMLKRVYERISPKNIRVILLGGEFIPQPLIQACFAQDLPVYKTYGMTETFSQSVTFNILEHPDKLTSVGQALPGVEIEISHPDAEQAGEIHLKSPMLMKGYLYQEDVQLFNTGDIGYLDEDNFLYILNRRKDIIISGGENIYPKEVEDLLYSLPGIIECALVPQQDETWGQVPLLFYAGTPESQEVFDFLSTKLAKYKLPRQIIKLNALPKNASGKILRKNLKNEA